MQNKALTQAQANLLAFIREYRTLNETNPTIKEMQERFGWASSNTARAFLAALEKKGAIKRGHGARSIKITEQVLAEAA